MIVALSNTNHVSLWRMLISFFLVELGNVGSGELLLRENPPP